MSVQFVMRTVTLIHFRLQSVICGLELTLLFFSELWSGSTVPVELLSLLKSKRMKIKNLMVDENQFLIEGGVALSCYYWGKSFAQKKCFYYWGKSYTEKV